MRLLACIIAVLALAFLVISLVLLALNLDRGRDAAAWLSLACVVANAAVFAIAIAIRMALS